MKQQRWEEPEKRKEEEKKSEKRRSHKKEAEGARKGRKVANHSVFPCFVAPEAQKVGSLKRRVRSHHCTPLWREADLEVKIAKMTAASSHFWKVRCRKVHSSVARGTF